MASSTGEALTPVLQAKNMRPAALKIDLQSILDGLRRSWVGEGGLNAIVDWMVIYHLESTGCLTIFIFP